MRISPLYISAYKYSRTTISDTIAQGPYNSNFQNRNTVPYLNLPTNINFGYEFALKKPKGIPCAYCGKPMLSKDDLQQIPTLKGQDLIDKIDSFVSQNPSVLSKQSNAALMLFKATVLSNSDKNGREILPIAYTRARTRMLIKQSAVYSKVLECAEKLDCKELKDYINKIKEQDNIINPDIPFNELADFLKDKIHIEFRKEVILNVMKLAGKYSTESNIDIWTDVMKTISSLPSSKSDPDAYLVKYISKALRKDPKLENDYISIKNDEALLFYSTILFPYLSSAEHVKPFSDNGESDQSNYLATHIWCNSKRQATKFSDFVLANPDVLDNIINYLKYINLNKYSRINLNAYLRDIRKKLVSELSEVADIPLVADFIKRLYTFNYLSADVKYTPDDPAQKTKTANMIENCLSNSNSDNYNDALNKLYADCVTTYINNYQRRITNLINHYDSKKHKTILEFFYKMLNSPFITTLFAQEDKMLNYTISNSFLKNYRINITNSLYEILSEEPDSYSDEQIVSFARRLTFKKTPELFCIKILLNSKQSDGTYDIEKIRALIKAGKVE